MAVENRVPVQASSIQVLPPNLDRSSHFHTGNLITSFASHCKQGTFPRNGYEQRVLSIVHISQWPNLTCAMNGRYLCTYAICS